MRLLPFYGHIRRLVFFFFFNESKTYRLRNTRQEKLPVYRLKRIHYKPYSGMQFISITRHYNTRIYVSACIQGVAKVT
jgi:hypothetical protein